jgi:hypothetical protein
VSERLWEETGCRAAIDQLAAARKHGFAVERVVFLTALHRLFASGSDRAADRWREDYRIAGIEALMLKKALEDCIAALDRTDSWPEIIADLDSLTETEIEHDGKRFVVRSAPRPAASLALAPPVSRSRAVCWQTRFPRI